VNNAIIKIVGRHVITLVLIFSVGISAVMSVSATNPPEEVDWEDVLDELLNAAFEELYGFSADDLLSDLEDMAQDAIDNLGIPDWAEAALLAAAAAGAAEADLGFSYTFDDVFDTEADVTIGVNGSGWDGQGSPDYSISITVAW